MTGVGEIVVEALIGRGAGGEVASATVGVLGHVGIIQALINASGISVAIRRTVGCRATYFAAIGIRQAIRSAVDLVVLSVPGGKRWGYDRRSSMSRY